jgi:hypothetical protein
VDSLDIFAAGWENDHRPVRILKLRQAFQNFQRLIISYAIHQLAQYAKTSKNFIQQLPVQLQKAEGKRESWKNIGGQLIREKALQQLLTGIRQKKIKSWEEIHNWYKKESQRYPQDKIQHAMATLLELLRLNAGKCTSKRLVTLTEQALETEQWIHTQILNSRAKDYQNKFRMMVYDSHSEMEEVMGKLENNPFIIANHQGLQDYTTICNELKAQLGQVRK